MKLMGETQGPVKQFHATMTGQGEDLFIKGLADRGTSDKVPEGRPS